MLYLLPRSSLSFQHRRPPPGLQAAQSQVASALCMQPSSFPRERFGESWEGKRGCWRQTDSWPRRRNGIRLEKSTSVPTLTSL